MFHGKKIKVKLGGKFSITIMKVIVSSCLFENLCTAIEDIAFVGNSGVNFFSGVSVIKGRFDCFGNCSN